MAPEQICGILKETFASAITEMVLDACRPFAVVEADSWVSVAMFLRDDPRLGLNFLRSITALDLLADDKLACVYDLMAIPSVSATEVMVVPGTFAVRVVTERSEPRIPSVAHVWPAANWHEREAYDMMGIVFEGHPHLERILCPDDWEGYPLRKDYAFPLEYHGIPATTEHEMLSPKH